MGGFFNFANICWTQLSPSFSLIDRPLFEHPVATRVCTGSPIVTEYACCRWVESDFFLSCVQQIPLPVIVAALLRVVSSGTSRASRLAALRDLDDRIKRSTSTLTSFGSSEALVSPVGSNSSRSVVRSLATGTGVSALSAGSDGPKVNTGSSKVTLDEVYPRLVTATYVMLGKAAPWAGLMTRICSTRCCCCCCCCCWFALVWNCRRENREGDPRDGASNLGLVAITCGE